MNSTDAVSKALAKYADDLCEGYCEREPEYANFDDQCGGCLARRTLDAYQQATPTPALDLEAIARTFWQWGPGRGTGCDFAAAPTSLRGRCNHFADAVAKLARADCADEQPTPAEPTDEAMALLTQAGQCAPAPGPGEVVGFVPVSHALRAITAALAERDALKALYDDVPADWSKQGYVSREAEIADMANVGRALIETVADNTRGSPLSGWMPMDSPVEIVTDALNCIADAETRATAAEAKFSGSGHVFFNPDTGEEYGSSHPVESGEVTDAKDVRRSTMQEDALHDAYQAEWQKRTAAEAKVAVLTEAVGELQERHWTLLKDLRDATDQAALRAEWNLKEAVEKGWNSHLSTLEDVRAAIRQIGRGE